MLKNVLSQLTDRFRSILIFTILIGFPCLTLGDVYFPKYAPDAIKIEPLLPQQGKEITITYDRKLSQKDFPARSSFVAMVEVASRFDCKTYRIQLSTDENKMHCCTGKMVLPQDAVVISISINPVGFYMQADYNILPVYKGNLPVSGALAEMMWKAPSVEAATHFFQYDERLYPNDFDRWIPFFMNKGKNRYDRRLFMREVNSLWNKVHSNISGNIEQQMSGYVACAIGYNQLNKQDQAFFALKNARELFQQNKDVINLTLSTVRGYDFLCSMIIPIQADRRGSQYSENMLSEIYEIASAQENIALYRSILQRLPMKVFEAGSENSINLVTKLEQLLIYGANPESIAGMTEVYLNMAKYLRKIGENQRAAVVLEKGIQVIEGIQYLSDPNSPKPVYMSNSLDGQKIAMKCKLAECYLDLEDTTKAQRYLLGVFDNIPSIMNQRSFSQAAKLLAEIFLAKSDIENSERYCAYALLLNNQGADQLFEKIQGARIKQGMAEHSIESTLEKYPLGDITNKMRVEPIDLFKMRIQ